MFRGNVSNFLRNVSDLNSGEGTSTEKTQEWEKGVNFRRGALREKTHKKTKLSVWLFNKGKKVYILQTGLATISIPSSILGISLVEFGSSY